MDYTKKYLKYKLKYLGGTMESDKPKLKLFLGFEEQNRAEFSNFLNTNFGPFIRDFITHRYYIYYPKFGRNIQRDVSIRLNTDNDYGDGAFYAEDKVESNMSLRFREYHDGKDDDEFLETIFRDGFFHSILDQCLPYNIYINTREFFFDLYKRSAILKTLGKEYLRLKRSEEQRQKLHEASDEASLYLDKLQDKLTLYVNLIIYFSLNSYPHVYENDIVSILHDFITSKKASFPFIFIPDGRRQLFEILYEELFFPAAASSAAASSADPSSATASSAAPSSAPVPSAIDTV